MYIAFTILMWFMVVIIGLLFIGAAVMVIVEICTSSTYKGTITNSTWSNRTRTNQFPAWKINGTAITSLKHFQELTQCDDELLAVLKLRYGEITH